MIRRREIAEPDNEAPRVVKLDDYKNDRGFYSVPTDIWFSLSDEDRKYVKDHNGKIRRTLGREDDTDGQPPRKRQRGVRSRRNHSSVADEKPEDNSGTRKAVQFRDIVIEEEKKEDDQEQAVRPADRIIQRRGALRFRTTQE